MRVYKALNQNFFSNGEFKIVPIRFEDRADIMKWRNEQMYHLRQDKPLTQKSQDNYFNETVARLFDQDKPNQILFSYLKNDKCIGYGGLVHINWVDKNAEISFIMKSELEKDEFELHWTTYLRLIDQLAFEDLDLHKLYIYAFFARTFWEVFFTVKAAVETLSIFFHPFSWKAGRKKYLFGRLHFSLPRKGHLQILRDFGQRGKKCILAILKGRK